MDNRVEVWRLIARQSPALGTDVLGAEIIPNRYRHRIVSELETALGGNVRIGRIAWGITTGLWVEVYEFSVAGASAVCCLQKKVFSP